MLYEMHGLYNNVRFFALLLCSLFPIIFPHDNLLHNWALPPMVISEEATKRTVVDTAGII